jgi:hypothetical protein
MRDRRREEAAQVSENLEKIQDSLAVLRRRLTAAEKG